MKTHLNFIAVLFLVLSIAIVSSCEKNNSVDGKMGKLEISLNLPDEQDDAKSTDADSSVIISYHLLISIEDKDGNQVLCDSLIPLYVFGSSYISKNIELKTGEFYLTKFMIINISGEVIFASPVEGSPLAYLTNDPLPISFIIYPDRITKVIPEVLTVRNQTSDNFGYASFGMQIIKPLNFWAVCVVDDTTDSQKTLITNANLTVNTKDGWQHSFELEANVNKVIIRRGSDIYDFLLEKEGYPSQNLEFTNEELSLTSNEFPLVLKIIPDNSNIIFEAKYSDSEPVIDGQIGKDETRTPVIPFPGKNEEDEEWYKANKYDVVFTRNDRKYKRPGLLYFQHDSTWLYIGIKTNIENGWDVYQALRIDGNHDHLLTGEGSEPHIDINVEYPAPGGWYGYKRYDCLSCINTHPVTPPTGSLSCSYINQQAKVCYEFKIKLSDLESGLGKLIGFCLFGLSDPYVEHAYLFPFVPDICDASTWAHLIIK